MVMSIIIMISRKVRSNIPPIGISQFIQSGVVGWGGGGDGSGGVGGSTSGAGSVVKALTALQAL